MNKKPIITSKEVQQILCDQIRNPLTIVNLSINILQRKRKTIKELHRREDIEYKRIIKQMQRIEDVMKMLRSAE